MIINAGTIEIGKGELNPDGKKPCLGLAVPGKQGKQTKKYANTRKWVR